MTAIGTNMKGWRDWIKPTLIVLAIWALLLALGFWLTGCAPLRETLKHAHENAQACRVIESHLELIDERQKEMIRRLDSIDDRLRMAASEERVDELIQMEKSMEKSMEKARGKDARTKRQE